MQETKNQGEINEENRVEERSEQTEMVPSTSTSDEVMTIDVSADERKRKPEKKAESVAKKSKY